MAMDCQYVEEKWQKHNPSIGIIPLWHVGNIWERDYVYSLIGTRI